MIALSKRAACVAWMACCFGASDVANCQSFEPKGQHAVVLGMDSNQVYLAVAPAQTSLHQSLLQRWEVHAAPRTGGTMKDLRVQPKQVPAWSALHHIQHVAIHSQGRKAVIAAQQHGDDLDLFLSYKLGDRSEDGGEHWTEPRPLDGLNSQSDEVFPRWEGQDLVFASNRTGAFTVYDASATLQLLRATRREGLPDGLADVLSVVTVGPSFTWVSGRRSQGAALSVQRWDWPQPTSPVPEGWTICVSLKDETKAAGTLAVRAVDSGDMIRSISLDPEGCASLAGLPADRAWSFQWEGTNFGASSTPAEAFADLKAPDGQLVRRYILNSSKGWSFVMLPLDVIQELSGPNQKDGSAWPRATLALLHYAHGQASPSPASWQAFQTWSKWTSLPEEPGRWTVVGHTDASGAQDVNDKLSLDRAARIASYLVDEMGWPESSVEVRAAGSAEPLGEDPAQNRRVEVLWVPSMQ